MHLLIVCVCVIRFTTCAADVMHFQCCCCMFISAFMIVLCAPAVAAVAGPLLLLLPLNQPTGSANPLLPQNPLSTYQNSSLCHVPMKPVDSSQMVAMVVVASSDAAINYVAAVGQAATSTYSYTSGKAGNTGACNTGLVSRGGAAGSLLKLCGKVVYTARNSQLALTNAVDKQPVVSVFAFVQRCVRRLVCLHRAVCLLTGRNVLCLC